jgi:hypothetical protein
MPRVVKIRQGFNPNSSSLSVNMTVLLAVTALSTLGTLVTATAVRLFRKNRNRPPAPTEGVPAAHDAG